MAYRAAESIRGYATYLRGQAAGRIGHDPSIDLVRENALLRRSKRRLLEVKYERLSGSLISVEEIRELWGRLCVRVRTIALNVPHRAREALPHLSRQDLLTLDEICREVLTEVGNVDEPPLPAGTEKRASVRTCERP